MATEPGTDKDKRMVGGPARRSFSGGGLRRALSQRLDTSGKECPDASLLAAYFDRELTPAEAKWELHFSTCARCQGQLAALARSEPRAEQPALRRFWHLPVRQAGLRWIAPLATAAAAAALWIVLRPTLPNLEPAAGGPARPASRPAAESTAPAKPAAEKEEAMGHRVEPPTAAARLGGLDRTAPAQKPEEKAEGVAPKGAERIYGMQAQISPEAALKAKAGPSGAAGAVSRDAAVATAVAAPTSPKAPETTADRAQLARNAPAARGRALLAAQTLELRVAAPGGQVMWRFGPEGTVEHSRDAGKTWKGQLLKDTPTLLAGSAPSETVCWAVGAAGTVWRTTDGERWETVSAPTQADLIRVEARDALHAAVTAADGTTYRTNDGGHTWLVP